MAEYILREAARDVFQRLAYDDWNQGAGTTWAEAFAESAELIDTIPAADVAPVRHGEWIKQDDGACFCSVCQLGLESFAEGIFYNYCPFCGALMDKDGDGDG